MVPGLRRHAQPPSQRSLRSWERQVGGGETEGGSAQTEIQTTPTDRFQGTILGMQSFGHFDSLTVLGLTSTMSVLMCVFHVHGPQVLSDYHWLRKPPGKHYQMWV